MKVSEFVKYLKGVMEEAGDIPLIVAPNHAQSHLMECPEVEDRARYWEGRELKRAKAVVIR